MDSEENKNIGQRIKESRQMRGLTQAQLADAIGISLSYMTKIENGHNNISVDVLKKICETLEVSSDSLLMITIPDTIQAHRPELENLLSGCTESEIRTLLGAARILKSGLLKQKQDAKEQAKKQATKKGKKKATK